MNDKIITAECHNCESSYQINYTEEFVSQEYPEHCPFCGELIEEIQGDLESKNVLLQGKDFWWINVLWVSDELVLH